MHAIDGYAKASIISSILILFTFSAIFIAVFDTEQWFDPSFSMATANKLVQDGFTSITWAEWDVHPPAYYYTLATWMLIKPHNISPWTWGQLLSLLCIAGFLLVAGIALHTAFGRDAALPLLVLSCSTTYIYYSQEIRSYAMLLLLSALIFLAIIKELRGIWYYVAVICTAILPWTHYFATLAIPFYTLMMVWYYHSKRILPTVWKKVLAIFVTGVVATFTVLPIALSQKARVWGAWFKPTEFLWGWPSAIAYTIIIVEESNIIPVAKEHSYIGVAFLGVFLFVCAALIYVLYRMWKRINWAKYFDSEEVLLWSMIFSIFLPVIGLLSTPAFDLFLGAKGFNNLYHHRLFLLVTWMVPVVLLIWWQRSAAFKHTIVKYAGITTLLLFCVAYFWFYGQYQTHYELRRVQAELPCEPITIVHEGPASALPFDAYARERNCPWTNVVSTNITPQHLNGGGGDAVTHIYYNHTIPEPPFFYLHSCCNISAVLAHNPIVWYVDDGIEAWYVPKRGES